MACPVPKRCPSAFPDYTTKGEKRPLLPEKREAETGGAVAIARNMQVLGASPLEECEATIAAAHKPKSEPVEGETTPTHARDEAQQFRRAPALSRRVAAPALEKLTHYTGMRPQK